MLLRGTTTVALLTLLSRVFGFVRELLVARLFGASGIADAYLVAFRIPNLLRSVFGEGALNSAFVPIITSTQRHDHDAGKLFARTVLSWLLLVTTTLCILGIIFAPTVVRAIAPGFVDDERFSMCVNLTRIMLPYIILVSVVSMMNGALNSVKIFGVSAWAQIVMNLTLVAGALVASLYVDSGAVTILAWSVLVGGVLQVLTQLPRFWKAGFSIQPSLALGSPEMRQFFKLFVGALLGAAVYQVTLFITTQLASLLPQGSVAAMSFADRLVQLPVGVFSLALSSVLLPILSQAYADNDQAAFSKNLLSSLRWTAFLLVPLSGWLLINAEPLVALLFKRGAFTEDDVHVTALVLKGFAIGLLGVSSHSLCVRALNAVHSTLIPSLIGVMTLVSSVVISLMLMGPIHPSGWFDAQLASLQSILPISLSLGAQGLALSSSISFTLAFLLALWAVLVYRPLVIRSLLVTMIKTFLATAAGIALVYFASQNYASPLMTLLGQTAIFVFGWGIIIFIARSSEVVEIIDILKARYGTRAK